MTTPRIAVTAVLVAAVGVSACSTDTAADTATSMVTSSTVAWGPCEAAFSATLPGFRAIDRLECATVPVPLDHAAADGPTIDIAISRLPATSGHRRRTLLTNPGGPAIEGRSLPAQLAEIDGFESLDDWDVIGIDIRGSGASTGASCTALDSLDAPPSSGDAAPTEQGLAAEARARVEAITAANGACAASDGRLLSTFTAANAAADLDTVREALGVETVSFLGVSWGTELGIAYRSLFPEHLDTMVLDSVAYLGQSAAEQDRDLAAARAAHVARIPSENGASSPDTTETDDAPTDDLAPDEQTARDPARQLNILSVAARTAYTCNTLGAVPDAETQWAEHVATARAAGLPVEDRTQAPSSSEVPGASLCSGWATPGQARPVENTGTPMVLVGHRLETVTPYPWTITASARAGGLILTVDDGAHGSAITGPCMPDLARFLASGAPPRATCGGAS